MKVNTVKELFDTATSEFKEALNKKDFKYCYNYIDDNEEIPDDFNITVECQFTELLLKHNINPLDYMDCVPENFLRKSNILSFTIPSNIKSIGDCAFEDCTYLTSIVIPSSVTLIDMWAFAGCISLKSITIPGSVKYIHDYAFSDCTSLKSIKIPNSVESIRNSAFAGCKCKIIYDGTEKQWQSIISDDTLEGFNGKIEFLK